MLKNDIKINASTIWRLLSKRGKLSLMEITELTGYKEFYISLALGWLLKENKVRFSEEDETLYIEPNIQISDMYY